MTVGLTVLAMDMRFQKNKMFAGIPNTFGKSDAEIAVMPPFVQHFRCEEQIEAGDPGCGDNKYNLTLCPDRAARASWHPGWRYHAMMGHTMAFTLLEVIAESLEQLIALEPTQSETAQQKYDRLWAHLEKLDAEEQADYDNIFHAPMPAVFMPEFDESLWRGDTKDVNKEAMKDILNVEKLAKNLTFCHTAMLPAEIRYKGLLTDNTANVGSIMKDGYDIGTWRKNITAVEYPSDNQVGTAYKDDQRASNNDELILMMDNDEYESCPEPTAMDHKDNFYISSLQGWRKLIFPNDSEKKYYHEFSVERSNGWVIVCLAPCEY